MERTVEMLGCLMIRPRLTCFQPVSLIVQAKCTVSHKVDVWRSGNALVLINEVNLR